MQVIEGNNTFKITSAVKKKPKLQCIEGGLSSMKEQREPIEDYYKAVSILEHNMLADKWFYEQILKKIDGELGPNGQSIKQKLNLDFLLHLSRFFFLVNSLDMNDRNALNSLITEHNKKVYSDIEQGLIEGSVGEKKKTIFSDARRSKITESCFALSRPAFAITELAHFLTDFMSEASATRMIDDLVLARILGRKDDPRIEAAGNRKLIVSDGWLEEKYIESLLMSRRSDPPSENVVQNIVP